MCEQALAEAEAFAQRFDCLGGIRAGLGDDDIAYGESALDGLAAGQGVVDFLEPGEDFFRPGLEWLVRLFMQRIIIRGNTISNGSSAVAGDGLSGGGDGGGG